jgi:hypothetical protein
MATPWHLGEAGCWSRGNPSLMKLMKTSETVIPCADSLIRDFKLQCRKALSVVVSLMVVGFIVGYFSKRYDIAFPVIVVTIMVGAVYIIARHRAAIGRIKCPECGGPLKATAGDRSVLFLECREQQIAFPTDCHYPYSGASPHKLE